MDTECTCKYMYIIVNNYSLCLVTYLSFIILYSNLLLSYYSNYSFFVLISYWNYSSSEIIGLPWIVFLYQDEKKFNDFLTMLSTFTLDGSSHLVLFFVMSMTTFCRSTFSGTLTLSKKLYKTFLTLYYFFIAPNSSCIRNWTW